MTHIQRMKTLQRRVTKELIHKENKHPLLFHPVMLQFKHWWAGFNKDHIARFQVPVKNMKSKRFSGRFSTVIQ